jgi:hypothetical protein
MSHGMRRDYFSVQIGTTDRGDGGHGEAGYPVLDITVEEQFGALDERLAKASGDGDRPAATIDVTYRLLDDIETGETTGVLALTDRLTGDFLLEANVAAETILELVRTAREYGTDAEGTDRYRVRVFDGTERVQQYDKGTFLVYNTEGSLLRRHSLIPSGVEL